MGAAELGEQQRDEKQLVITTETSQALAPVDIGPKHANNGKRPEQQRETTGQAQYFTPHRREIETRNNGDEPNSDQNSSCGC